MGYTVAAFGKSFMNEQGAFMNYKPITLDLEDPPAFRNTDITSKRIHESHFKTTSQISQELREKTFQNYKEVL
jgi:hypothetical protein